MNTKHLALLVTALAMGNCTLLGCTLLTRFDDGTQPCDERAAPADQCVAGFHCENGLCVDGGLDTLDAGRTSDAGSTDAGSSDAGSSDAGSSDAGGRGDAGSTGDAGARDAGP
jgi:hypothetical protein